MIETIVLYVAIALGGYFVGYRNSTVTTECRDNSLITTQCVDIQPPSNDSFGATTESYIGLIDTYKKCRQACEIK